jgi:hypothetical protein
MANVCTDVTSVNDDLISFALHYVFDVGEELISTADIRFRSEQGSPRGSARGRLRHRSDLWRLGLRTRWLNRWRTARPRAPSSSDRPLTPTLRRWSLIG